MKTPLVKNALSPDVILAHVDFLNVAVNAAREQELGDVLAYLAQGARDDRREVRSRARDERARRDDQEEVVRAVPRRADPCRATPVRAPPSHAEQRQHEPEGENEDGAQYEERVWRTKVHVEDGHVAVPSIALRDSIADGGKDISLGKNKFAKNLIRVSVLPLSTFFLTNKTLDDLSPVWMPMVLKAGRSGSGSRVNKIIPHLDPGWEVEGRFMVMDDRLTEDKLAQAIGRAGLMCGIGALRVQGGGVRGRYELVSIEWE